MRHHTIQKLLAGSLALGLLSGCGDNKDDPTPVNQAEVEAEGTLGPQVNLLGALDNDDRFSTLVAAIQAAGLSEALSSEAFTVFAPTNEAFDALPTETLENLLADQDKLREVLLFHVVAGKLAAQDVLANEELKSLNDLKLAIVQTNGLVFIDQAQIISTDLNTANGVIHAIDRVLLPSSIFSIAELASKTAELSTLLAAVEAAGLGETLAGTGPFTVFAPINSAFAALDQDALAELLTQADQLRDILLLHVVPGNFDAKAVVESNELNTALGNRTLKVELRNGEAFVNGSRIIATDIKAANGVVHLIESVILP